MLGMLGKSGGWGFRVAPSVVTAVAVLGLAALWQCDRVLYLAWRDIYTWKSLGDMPFSDLGAVLQAGACWRHGADVYGPNACMNGGMFNYSPLLLRIGLLGLGAGAVPGCGLLLCLAFIAACALLPPAQTYAGLALRCGLMLSCATMHAFESGNIDLAIFGLVALGVALQRARFAGRLAGYAFFLFGGALKFYPAVLLGLLLRESRWRAAGIGTAIGLAAAILVARNWRMMAGILGALPLGLPFHGSFSAMNLPFGIAMLACMSAPSVAPGHAVIMSAVRHPHFAAYVILSTKALVVAGVLAGMKLAPLYVTGLAALDEGQRLFLAAGSMLLAFCFFSAPNYEYRAVFLLFTVPGLQAMSGACATVSRVMLLLMPLLLCERVLWEIFGAAGRLLPGHALGDALGIVLWLLREAGWWFIMLQLTAIGFAFLRTELQGGRAGREVAA